MNGKCCAPGPVSSKIVREPLWREAMAENAVDGSKNSVQGKDIGVKIHDRVGAQILVIES